MSTPLESFLEEVDQERQERQKREGEDDSPAHVVKNDNSGASSSGMIDMCEMAMRYQQANEASVDAPIVDCTTRNRDTILFPISEDQQGGNLLKIGIGAGAVVGLVVATVVVTMTMMKPAVVAMEAPTTSSEPTLTAPAVAMPDEVLAQPIVEAVEPIAIPEPVEVAVVAEAVVIAEEIEPQPVEVKKVEKPVKVPVVATKREKKTEEPEVIAAEPVVAEPVVAEVTPVEEEAVAKPVVAAVVEPAEKTQTCDEVLCLLEGKACCGEPAQVEPVEPTIDTSLPESLSRSQIADGLRAFEGRLNTCGTRNELSGAVTLKLKIAADGSVTRVSAKTDNEAFNSCIGILKSASFGETQRGTTVSYPVILR